MKLTDLTYVHKWWNDATLTGYYDRAPIFSPEEIGEQLRRNIKSPDRLDLIIETQSGEPIGLTYLRKIDWRNRNCELHAMLGERHKRNIFRGIHAQFLLLLYSFHKLNMHKVYARVIGYALEQRRLIKAVGFVEEAIQKDFFYQRGQNWDLHIYGLLDRQFEALLNTPPGRRYLNKLQVA